MEDDGLGRAAAHEHGRELLLWHGSPRIRYPHLNSPAGRAARLRTRPSRSSASP
jgi:hypothetical protein